MNKFWELFRESVIVQASVTLLVVCTWVALLLTDRNVPPELSGVVMLILGFYFGSKTQARINK